DCTIVARPPDSVFDRMVFRHQGNCLIKIVVADVALPQRSVPERTLAFRAPTEGQDNRQSDFSLTEIVADIFAQLCGLAAVIERIVDELKGKAEIHPEGAAGRALGFFSLRPRPADFATQRKRT